MRVTSADDPEGMRSITLVKVLGCVQVPVPDAATPTPFSLLAVTIKTGRTHQIRVHLASAGHPIAGDDKYGHFDTNKALQKHGLKRMFLHAWKLSVTHPVTQEKLQLQTPLPPELHDWCHVSRLID